MSSTPLTAPTDASAPSPWRTVFALDLRALALYRIGLAAVLLLMLAQLWPDLAAFTTDNGILPRSARPQLNVEEAFPGLCWQLSLHMASGELAWQQGLVALQALVAAALLVGWKTRWMALASWLLLVSLQARNPLILQGGDDVLRNMLFWSLFLPLGARFSLDANRRTLRGDAQPLPDDVAHLGTAGFILQLLCVYFFTGLLKSDPVWRTEFTALHYALHLDHLTTRFGYWLVSFPALTKLLTAGTMLLEHAGPILLLVPLTRLARAPRPGPLLHEPACRHRALLCDRPVPAHLHRLLGRAHPHPGPARPRPPRRATPQPRNSKRRSGSCEASPAPNPPIAPPPPSLPLETVRRAARFADRLHAAH